VTERWFDLRLVKIPFRPPRPPGLWSRLTSAAPSWPSARPDRPPSPRCGPSRTATSLPTQPSRPR
jgi:hypothetical protein